MSTPSCPPNFPVKVFPTSFLGFLYSPLSLASGLPLEVGILSGKVAQLSQEVQGVPADCIVRLQLSLVSLRESWRA